MKISSKIYTSLIVLAVLAIAAEIGWLVYKNGLTKKPVVSANTTSTPITYPSLLDGTDVSTTEEIVPPVVGVMIDNHPDARPEAGLSQARIIYEAPVEGGLTRYFAIFNANDKIAKVGPVRSARPYFLDWMAEYGNSSYWHCGGSPVALELIKQYKMWDVNQFFYDPYFWRGTNHDAPHNLYTSSDKWQDLIAGTPHQDKKWQGWSFSKNLPSSTSTDITEMQINSGINYVVGWKYDKDAGKYIRSLNNVVETDEAGVTLTADNILVQEVETEVIDEEGRRSMTTVGTGNARLLRDGKLFRGTWKKADRTSRTRFFDQNGIELSLKPGQTWVEVVAEGTQMEVSN